MRFDLKKMLLRGPDHVREEFTADLSGRDWPGYRVSQPVSALFEAWVQGSEVFLELQATAELSGECARCLDPVTQECSLTRSWKVKEHDLAGEDELPVDERGVLDLDELLYQELVLEAPPLLLCSEDCTGLCPVCGRKKSEGCLCQPEEKLPAADARLAILKQLLN